MLLVLSVPFALTVIAEYALRRGTTFSEAVVVVPVDVTDTEHEIDWVVDGDVVVLVELDVTEVDLLVVVEVVVNGVDVVLEALEVLKMLDELEVLEVEEAEDG